MSLLEISDLTKVFSLGESVFGGGATREVCAVDDVTLDIQSGETLGLVGESGSGKSTLGRLVLRLIEPTSGKIVFEGRDLVAASHGEMRRLRRDMQIIFQIPLGSIHACAWKMSSASRWISTRLLVRTRGAHGLQSCFAQWASTSPPCGASHTNSAEVSGSESELPEPWRCIRSSSWPTNPSPLSTSALARRSSIS